MVMEYQEAPSWQTVIMETIRMENMGWLDIKAAIDNGFTTVVVGVGSAEQHGHHLPIKTDALIGNALAHAFAVRWGNVLQAPTICVGCSEHHMGFPGTITLKKETLKAILIDYIESLSRHGFKTIILLPSHGGNFSIVDEVVAQYKDKNAGIKVVGVVNLIKLFDFVSNLGKNFDVTPEKGGVHSGDFETSIMLFLAKELVRSDRYKAGYIGKFGELEHKTMLANGIKGLSDIGVLGDPCDSTAEKGKVYFEGWVDFCIAEIKNLI